MMNTELPRTIHGLSDWVFRALLFAGLSTGASAELTPIWIEQVASVERGAAPPLPDFSWAGYAYGEASIPESFDLPVFPVVEFGAVPDDDRSDREGIQDAIDAAEAAGGGVVLFPSGTFLVNEEVGLKVGLEIHASNIILKGQGSGVDGTRLLMRHQLLPFDPLRGWTVPYMITFTPPGLDVNSRTILEPGNQPKTRVLGPVSAGSFELEVADASGFAIGDVVTLCTESTGLVPELLGCLETRPNWSRIRERGIAASEKLEVTGVDGTRIRFASPIMSTVSEDVDWFLIRYPVLRNCGFEDIHFEGNFHEPFVHHKNLLHDMGFSAVNLQACLNSWVRRSRFSNMNSAVVIRGSLASSALMLTIDGNRGHSGVNITFGSRNLSGLVRDEAGQFHGPNTSHLAMGSVHWRHETTRMSGPDLHGTYPRLTLLDALRSASFDNHGANTKDLPNHLDGLVYWNFEVTDDPLDNFDFWELLEDEPERPYGPLTAVKPIIVGLHGSGISFAEDSLGRLESQGEPVRPESLYEAQLELRLGYRPGWVDQVLDAWGTE